MGKMSLIKQYIEEDKRIIKQNISSHRNESHYQTHHCKIMNRKNKYVFNNK